MEERKAARMVEMEEVGKNLRFSEAQAAVKALKAKWREDNHKKEEYN